MIHAIQGLWKESFLTPKLYSSQKIRLVQELCPDLSVDEYVQFDESVPTAEPSFDTGKWYGDRNPNLNALTE